MCINVNTSGLWDSEALHASPRGMGRGAKLHSMQPAIREIQCSQYYIKTQVFTTECIAQQGAIMKETKVLRTLVCWEWCFRLRAESLAPLS
jgi:hypothetical protein